MKSAVKIALMGAFFILVFDAAAAMISKSFGIEYVWFGFGSIVIYTLFGCLGGRQSRKWFLGAPIGTFLGLIDSTLGWAVSWIIGPGKPADEMSSVLIGITIISVSIEATVLGLIGGALSLIKRSDA